MRDHAVRFATKAHEGQVRNLPDGRSEPYVAHVLRVGEGVSRAGARPKAGA